MYKKLLSETIIYGIGAIMPRVINFLLNPFYIDRVDSAELSQFFQLYAVVSFVNVMLSFGFETAFFRFGKDKENAQKTFSTSFWFVGFNAIAFLIIALLFNQTFANWLDYPTHPEYLKWFTWIAFFDALCVIPFAWLRLNNKPIKYSAVRVIQSLVQTSLILCLFLFVAPETLSNFGLKEQVSYIFVPNVIASILGFVLLVPILKNITFQFDKKLFKQMIPYAWPIMLAGVAFMVNENFDKAYQRMVIPESNAGAYGGSYKLAVLITLFVTAYRMGIEPFFFKQMDKSDAKNTYAKVTEYFTAFASVAALGVITNLEWLKQLFIPNQEYWIALDIIPIVIIANVFLGVYYNLSTWYKVTDRTSVGTIVSWGAAAITLLINLIFLPTYGFMVSAWATLAAYAFMMLVSYFWGQKAYPIPYKWRKISIYLILLIFFSVISYRIFEQNLFVGNTLFIIYIAIVLFIEKKSLDLIRKK